MRSGWTARRRDAGSRTGTACLAMTMPASTAATAADAKHGLAVVAARRRVLAGSA